MVLHIPFDVVDLGAEITLHLRTTVLFAILTRMHMLRDSRGSCVFHFVFLLFQHHLMRIEIFLVETILIIY